MQKELGAVAAGARRATDEWARDECRSLRALLADVRGELDECQRLRAAAE